MYVLCQYAGDMLSVNLCRPRRSGGLLLLYLLRLSGGVAAHPCLLWQRALHRQIESAYCFKRRSSPRLCGNSVVGPEKDPARSDSEPFDASNSSVSSLRKRRSLSCASQIANARFPQKFVSIQSAGSAARRGNRYQTDANKTAPLTTVLERAKPACWVHANTI